MSELMSRATRASRQRAKAIAADLETKLRHRAPLTAEDEAELARQYATDRGHHRSRKERSKRRHELSTDAPAIHWTPPQLRKPE